MKKRIFIIISLVIVVVLVLLFLFRHKIVGHAFKVSISEKTESSVELEIGHLDYNVFNSTVTLTGSELTFHNIFVNKEKTIELSEFKFDELSLVELSIFDLLFKHELLAHKFIVNKPSFWFQENNNPKAFKERPKEILKSLKEHPDLLGSLVVIVDEIEVTHGKIDLTSIINEDNNKGNVEFKLLLKDINTTTESILNEGSFLFAKHHFFKLSNFNYSLPNGDLIRFDSLVFGSDYNDISIGNFGMKIIDTSMYSPVRLIDMDINNVTIFGTDLIGMKQFNDIEIDSLKISDANISVIRNDEVKNKPIESIVRDSIKRNFNFKIDLGKLLFEDINIAELGSENDTLIILKKLDFRVENIIVDSSVLLSRHPKYDSSSVFLALEECVVNNKEIGLYASFNNLYLDEKHRMLSLSNIHIKDDIIGEHSYLVNANALEIYGISLDDQLKKRKMKLGLLLSNPEINIDLEKFKSKAKGDKKLSLANIIIDNIEISDGIVNIYEKEKIDLGIVGLNIDWDSINFSDPEKIRYINTSNLGLNLKEFHVDIFENQTSISSGYIEVNNNEILLNNLVASLNESGRLVSDISVRKISGQGANIDEVLVDKQINLKQLLISKPIIKANVGSGKGKHSNSSNNEEKTFDYSINIEDFQLMDGNFDIVVDGEKPIKLKSDISLETKNISIDDIHNSDWIHKLDWDLRLYNTWLEIEGYELVFDKLLSDKNKETLFINNLKLNEIVGVDSSVRIQIEDFAFTEVMLSGFDYSRIINNQMPVIESASIKGANIDLRIDKRVPKKGINPRKSLYKTKFPFELDQLKMDELSLKLEIQDSLSLSTLEVGQVNFAYKLDSSVNIIDDVDYLNIDNISFSDTNKNSYLSIASVDFLNSNNQIDIVDITTGSISVEASGKQQLVDISKVGFDKVFISHTYPLSIDLGNISVDELKANIVSVKDDKRNSSSDVYKKELPNFISRIGIENIDVVDIDLDHTSISDSITKTISLLDITLNIDSVSIDSSILNSNRYDYAKSVSLFVGKNKFIIKDSLYNASIKNISYNFHNKNIIVDSLLLVPRFPDKEFFNLAVYQIARTKLVARQIVASDFRLDSFFNDKKIHFGGVEISGLVADMYKNKKYDIKPGTYKKMPQEAILGINSTIIIDSLKTYDALIKYQEIKEKSFEPGALFLDRFNISVYNINNDLKLLDSTSSITTILDARFMGQANMHVEASFMTLSPDNEFVVNGHVDELEFSAVNNLTENLVGVTLSRGSGSVEIPEIKGNSVSSEGVILFKYNKLKIELYDREKAQVAKGLGGSIAGLLLNDIFIKSNNPRFLGRTRPGDVYFKRDTQKSVVSYTWKSILSGIMSTMGYNNKEQRQEKRAVRKARKN